MRRNWLISLVGLAGCGSVATSNQGPDAAPDALIDASGPPPPPAPVCPAPIAAVDVSHPTTVVTSCTEAALAAAVAQGGVITFACGGPATITLTRPIELPGDRDTVIDGDGGGGGGGAITIDGAHATRLFELGTSCSAAVAATVTLQHLTLANGAAHGSAIPAPPQGAPAYCSQGEFVDGGGGAIWIRGAALHVIDAVFTGNSGAELGPDVGGGAIYAVGSPDLTIVGSTFYGNHAANGGAVGSLNSILTLVDDTFADNHATGSGANVDDGACPMIRPPWPCGTPQPEAGSGGDGGAVAIDGGLDGAVAICGATFTGNSAGALGGAIFRTVDASTTRPMTIDRSDFEQNRTIDGDPHAARFNYIGGGALYTYMTDVTITASTFADNAAGEGGALYPTFGALTISNATFSGNHATEGPGGAIRLINGNGRLQSCTFAGNRVDIAPADAAPNLPPQGAALAGGAFAAVDDSIFDDNTTMDPALPNTCVPNVAGADAVQFPANDPPCVPGAVFADPRLDGLGDHGGPTPTLAPAGGSPAIGAGHACPPTDQRGNPRPADHCALGAVEVP